MSWRNNQQLRCKLFYCHNVFLLCQLDLGDVILYSRGVQRGGVAVENEEIASCFPSKAEGHFKSVDGPNLAHRTLDTTAVQGFLVDWHAFLTMDVLASKINMFRKVQKLQNPQLLHHLFCKCTGWASKCHSSHSRPCLDIKLQCGKKQQHRTTQTLAASLHSLDSVFPQCSAMLLFFPYPSEVIDLINSDTPRVFGCNGFLLCGW